MTESIVIIKESSCIRYSHNEMITWSYVSKHGVTAVLKHVIGVNLF